jgi:hypothetical protein
MKLTRLDWMDTGAQESKGAEGLRLARCLRVHVDAHAAQAMKDARQQSRRKCETASY